MSNDITRLVNSSNTELTCVLYRELIDSLGEELRKPISDRKTRRCTEIVKTLVKGLDMNVSISLELFSLYLYINKLLLKKRDESLCEAIKLVKILLSAYEEVSSLDKPIIHSKVSVGLTYGNQGYATEISETTKSFMV